MLARASVRCEPGLLCSVTGSSLSRARLCPTFLGQDSRGSGLSWLPSLLVGALPHPSIATFAPEGSSTRAKGRAGTQCRLGPTLEKFWHIQLEFQPVPDLPPPGVTVMPAIACFRSVPAAHPHSSTVFTDGPPP